MKAEKSTKEVWKKIFIILLAAITLFSTNTLTHVLTQQKALQASTLRQTSEHPFLYDDLRYENPDAGKTDRFIVKYKDNKAQSFKSKLPYTLLSSNSIDSVKDSLEKSSVLPDSSTSGSKNGNDSRSTSSRYSDMELLILSEKVFPDEFEKALISSGAYNDILYIQPDYKLKVASLSIEPISSTGINPSSASSFTSSTPVVIVAVIDTGVDPTHPAYASYLHPSTPNVYDSSNPLAFAHGTHIAGIIAGEAVLYGANIQILVLPVFSNGHVEFYLKPHHKTIKLIG